MPFLPDSILTLLHDCELGGFVMEEEVDEAGTESYHHVLQEFNDI